MASLAASTGAGIADLNVVAGGDELKNVVQTRSERNAAGCFNALGAGSQMQLTVHHRGMAKTDAQLPHTRLAQLLEWESGTGNREQWSV